MPKPVLIAVQLGRRKIEAVGPTDDDVVEMLQERDDCFYSFRKFSYADIESLKDRYNCRINTIATGHNQPVEFEVYELPHNVMTSDMYWLQNWWQEQPTPEPSRTITLYKIESI